MKRRFISMFLVSAMAASMMMGCGSAAGNDSTGSGASGSGDAASGDVTEFSYFITMPGSEINSDNEIQQVIAEKTGVKVKETWLTGQSAEEAVGTLVAGGEYPDYLCTDDMTTLLDAGALIPLDEYIDAYPEFKNEWYTEAEWEKFRQPDGHIYWINQFENTHGDSKKTTHNDEAFWIQNKALKWANYPKLETMDDYFDLIERYIAENPTMEDGTEYIGYTILCEDWRYFCLENAGQFLGGDPNDGSVIVNKDTMTIEDYNTSDDTIKYFKKLNEEYQKGIVDPESFTQTYDEYIAKLSTGRVLGMVDQWWDFQENVNGAFKTQGLDEAGCNYIPLGLTTEAGMDNRWHTDDYTVNCANGIAISVDCADPEKAFKFIVDTCMDQELIDLRVWGLEGVDYLVDDQGLYYRTDEMRMNAADTTYKASHLCPYSYFLSWGGTSFDGKNAMRVDEQPSEFMNGMATPLKETFDAYGVTTYPDFIGSVVEANGPWFPMYSYSNGFTTATPGGVAWTKMGECKHEWLPKVVMADDFEKGWADYMDAYNACKPEDFLSEMQAILDTFK